MFTVVCCVFAVHTKTLTVVWFEQMDLESYALTAPSGTDESMESFPLTKGKKKRTVPSELQSSHAPPCHEVKGTFLHTKGPDTFLSTAVDTFPFNKEKRGTFAYNKGEKMCFPLIQGKEIHPLSLSRKDNLFPRKIDIFLMRRITFKQKTFSSLWR